MRGWWLWGVCPRPSPHGPAERHRHHMALSVFQITSETSPNPHPRGPLQCSKAPGPSWALMPTGP